MTAPGPSSSLSLLLVEDEPLVAMMLEDFVDSLGHRVAASVDSVESGLQAVAAGGIDAAIIDVQLSGREPCWPLADALDDRGIAFLIASGGHVTPPPARHAGAPLLSKPYTLDSVRGALERLLSET